ncbi:MAG: signal peptidase I [Bacteroidota bacterium]
MTEASSPAATTTPTPTVALRQRRRVWSWLRVVFAAVTFALALRIVAFEAYRIPSTSMEDTLLIGDFVLVSKVHYGARVLGARLPGLSAPARGDVIVFNYPPSPEAEIARRLPYIKRVVGLPGDTLTIRDKQVQIGATALGGPVSGRSLWEVRGRLPLRETLDSLGISRRVQQIGQGAWAVSSTTLQAAALARVPGVESVDPYVRPGGDGSASFPLAQRYSLDNYGPVVVPRRGLEVALTDDTWPVVRPVIERFEGRTAERTAGAFLIDGQPAESYTFGQDYFFVLGDSRDDSADSRTWGFVPFDHVIGKAVVVYFSWDAASSSARWERTGKTVSP